MPVLFKSGIRLISIHMHGHIVTKPQVYVLRQGYRCPPIISFEVKIHLSASIIINTAGRIIPVGVFRPISMGGAWGGGPLF